MAKPSRVGDMEVNQDISHERLEWKIERVGWLVMAALLLAALVGLLGPGPLSSAVAGVKNSALWVEYNRFERYQAPTILLVHLGPQTTRDGTVRLWLRREYVENIELQHIDPEPESVEVTPDRFIYTFKVSALDRSTAVRYHFEPEKFWRMAVSMGLESGPRLEFTQFYYP